MLPKFSVDKTLLKAKKYANKGNFEKAKTLYEEVLSVYSKNKRAHQGLEDLSKLNQNDDIQNPPQEIIDKLISLYNKGEASTIVEQSQLLLQQYPKAFMVWNILGASAARVGNFDKAIKAYKKCISLKPHYVEAYSNMGVALNNQGKADEAIEAYEKAISLKSNYYQVYRNMGIALYGQGRLIEAIKAYKKCISINPNYSDAYFNLGVALHDQGNFDKAIEMYQRAISINPNYAKAYNNIGNVLKDQGKLAEAKEAYDKSISIQPNYANAFYNMGNILKDLGNPQEAIEAYKKAISLKPDHSAAYSNLGLCLHDEEKFDEAIEAYNNAILHKPHYADALNNLAVALQEQSKFDEAIVCLKKAISLKPDFYEAMNNMGNCFRLQGDSQEAIKLYNNAILLKPDYAQPHYNLSLSLLSIGKVKEGLDKQEWRWKSQKTLSQRHFSQPLWDGKESLKGKRILLWFEQGIGDTLNWVSRLPLITSQADHCILECQEKLVPLLERSFPDIEVKSEDRSLDLERDDFDVHLPMGSLYKHFIDEILAKPQVDPYLIPDPVRVNYWKERLSSLGKGPYVGISWKSSVVSDYRRQHYPPITEWSPILTIPDVTFINLQYKDFTDDLARVKDEFGVTVHNFEDLDQYGNVDDVAALSAALDMVVSTKVTPPIITSGVGTLTKIANWRQSTFNNIITNPVSSTLEMFDKDTEEPWDGVFNLIAEEVTKVKNRSDNIKDKKKGSEDPNKLNQNYVVQNPPQKAVDQLINYYNQGKISKVFEEAQLLVEKYPEAYFVWNILGVSAAQLGMLDKAIEAYKKSIYFNPNYAEAYCNMGTALKDQEKLEQAISSYNKAISLKPDYAEAYSNIGVVLQTQGNFVEALKAYHQCISLKPTYDEAYLNMGVCFQLQGKLNEAIQAFKMSLLHNPNSAVAYMNIGNVLKDQDKLEEAIKFYNKSISLNPEYSEAYSNMGLAFHDQGKLDEAIEVYNKCISINPDFTEAYNNLGNAFRNQENVDKAIIAYKKAISLDPNYAEAHRNLSFSLLSSGKVKEALDEYEWRWKSQNTLSQRHFSQPLWDGKESLKGKRILLWFEQGIGDTLNWASRLPLIISQADHCILECQEKLVPLLERSFPDIEVKSEDRSIDSKRDDFDVHLPMGSLYKHFIDEILAKPQVDPYLIPDPVRVNYWKERLSSLGKGPYVGISWKSSVVSDYRRQHYPPITEWSPILTIPDVTFINLQYKDFTDDLARVKDEFGVTVHNFEDLDQYGNVDDVAALSAALDMVVSTKVTPPIITSGVGTLTKIANWRQSTFNNILTNPVSSTLEMFDKDTEEPWDGVFNLIAEEVTKVKNRSDNIEDKKKGSEDPNKLNQNYVVQNPPQKAVDQLINYYNQGKISKVFEEAQLLVEKYPEAYFVWNILGVSAAQLGMLDKAIEAYKKSIYFNPNYAEAYCNMGTALKDQEKLEQAISSYNKAISLKPDYAKAYLNMGVCFQLQGKLNEAIKLHNNVISLKPDDAEAHFNLSLSLLTKESRLLNAGEIKEGLDGYEWRWKIQKISSQRHFSQPLWDGKESLKGKRILLWCEYGIGDTLNWASRLPLITSQADHCILECQEKLVPLLERSFPDIEVKSEDRSIDSKRDDFDVHLPMGSLYKHFIDEILAKPQVDPYLIPDPVRVNYWKERLSSLGKGPYVGISWKSSVVSDYRRQHYPPITEWSPILTIPDVTFINLQYKDFTDDLARVKDEFGVTVHNFEDLDQYGNVDDVAALSAALDMVVSTKVTPPIITSGVGTLTKIANWRQSTFNNILTNPVSSTLEMFDKDTEEPWDGVFNLIAEEVTKVKNRSDNIEDKKKGSEDPNKLNQNYVVQNPPQKAVDQLINYYNQGKISKVFEEAQLLVEKYPEAYFVWNILGVSAAQLGMLDKAIEAYKKSIYFNPNYAEAYCNMGTALKDQEKLEQAISSYNKAISLKPDYAEAYSNIGVVLQTQGNFVEALKAYHQCISLKPTYDEAYLNMGVCFQLQGKLNEAIQAFKMSLLHNPNSAVAYMNIGNVLKDQEKLEQAISSYNKAISLKPDYAEAYCNIGLIFHDQGKFDEAIEVYNKCISLTPNYAEVFVNKGNTLKDLGNPQEAIEAYKKAISLKPNFALAFNNMGSAFKDLGKLDQSIELYKKAITFNPNYGEAYCNMGNILKDLDKPQEAIEAYKKAISLKPNFALAFNNMGSAFKDLGKLDQAIEFYKKAITFKPNYADAFNNLAVALQEQSKFDEAIVCLKKAISLKPDFYEAMNNMGNCFRLQGDSQEAIKLYNNAILLKPDYAQPHYNLSLSLLSIGKVKEGLDKQEWRWKSQNTLSQRHFSQPLWDGKESLKGKRILLWFEQGIGDTLNWPLVYLL